MINKSVLFSLLLTLCITLCNAQDEIRPEVFQKCPQIHIENAFKAMGGKDTLKALKSISLDGYGHRYKMDQSERAEGPYLIEYMKFEEIRDIQGKKIKKSIKTIPIKTAKNIIVNGLVFQEEDKKYTLLPDGMQEELFLNPEAVLFTALKSPSLNCEKHVMMQGIVNNVIKFIWNKNTVTLYLNSFTNLPTAVEITRPYPYDNYNIWGDIKTVVSFSDWSYVKGGLWYPLQWNIEQNGMPYKTFTILDIKINMPVSESEFTPPSQILQAKKDIKKKPIQKPTEIIPGIWKFKDSLSTYFIKQEDGILILDAPYSSAYSIETFNQIKLLFPNAWMKGVVSTSDNWQAIGGLREYAAMNIPIFSLDLNKVIIEKLLKANFATAPDKYSQNIYKFKLNSIYQDFSQGSGLNEALIFPLRSESGERNLIVYFPQIQLLYASDLIKKDAEGNLVEMQKVMELNKILLKKGLVVKDVISMYVDKTPWKQVLKKIEAVSLK